MSEQQDPKIYSDLTQHVLLLSKGHYGRTGDIVDDLIIFMHKWSGCEKEVYTDVELMRIMSSVFSECASRPLVQEFIQGIATPWARYLTKSEPMTLKEMIESMLGLMSIIPIRERDSQNRFVELVKLPEPNPKYVVSAPDEEEEALEEEEETTNELDASVLPEEE